MFFILTISIVHDVPNFYQDILKAGKYTIHCYGAQGGQAHNNGKPKAEGGLGAHVSGKLMITGTGTTVYSFVGGQGESSPKGPNAGGFNGGGSGGEDTGASANDASGGGGGATDVRLYRTNKKSRIIVAAGGSGGAYKCQGAPGGIKKHYKADENNVFVEKNINGTVSGIGGNGVSGDFTTGSGGGGGYTGGPGSGGWTFWEWSSYKSVAYGGTSYISGCEGFTPYQNYEFTSCILESGLNKLGSFQGNKGNGKVEIISDFLCPEYCFSCTSGTKCSKCFDNYFFFNNKRECRDKCPDGYVGIGDECKPCTSNCKTCETSQSHCLTCKDNFVFHNNNCLRECPKGFTEVNKVCKECDKTCSECSDSTSTCTTCEKDYYLDGDKCVTIDKCPEGSIGLDGVCEKCSPDFNTCVTSQSTCASCIGETYLHNGQCLPKCPSSYTNIGNECIKCESPCSECSGSTTKCTSCESGYFLDGETCVDKCPTHKYGVNRECKECHTSCEECTEETKCTSCTGSYYLDADKYECTENCPSGTIPITVDGQNKCEKCTSNCETCEGSVSSCKTCINGYKIDGTECKAICNSGMTLVGAECQSCISPCAECSSSTTTCLACVKDKYLSGTECVDLEQCPSGTVGVDGICKQCTSNCERCDPSDLSKCTLCKENMFNHNGECKSECPKGFTNEGKECKECKSECSECSESTTTCTACNNDFFLDVNVNECVTEDKCPHGTIGLKGVCEKCSENCETCVISQSTCASCKGTMTLHNGQCTDGCPIGFTNVNNECQQCESPCYECSESTKTCTSCVSGYFLSGTECKTECPPGTYGEGRQCKNCDLSCGGCTEEPTKCTSCKGNSFLDADNYQCTETCPDNTLAVTVDGQNKCEKCTSNCASCEGNVSTCTSCIEGFYLYNKQCITSCPKGTALQDNKCKDCEGSCDECAGTPTTCTACKDNLLLYENTCVSSCPKESIQEGNRCIRCDISCKECQNTVDECTICADGFYRMGKKCYFECSQASNLETGTYYGLDKENSVCVECSDSDCIDCSSNFSTCSLCTNQLVPDINGCFPPDYVLLIEENCSQVERCGYTVEKEKSVQVLIIVTSFNNRVQDMPGGGFYIVNCAVLCNNTLFFNCSSNTAGGAAYIKNFKDLDNKVFLANLTFFQCKAQYGGAMYIYSSYERNDVTIYNTKFYSNQANRDYVDSVDKNLNGGSALFLSARSCDIRGCIFENNKGGRGALRIYEKFDENNEASARLIKENEEHKGISISNCKVRINPREEHGIFVDGSDPNLIKINECEFKGKLHNGAKYIGGKLNYHNSRNIVVKNCDFEYDEKTPVKIELLKDE